MLDTRRHLELFDPDYFTDMIHVIGAGATGSWLALQLAKLGIKGDQITVWDFDVVEEHNIPNQAYNLLGEADRGEPVTEGGHVGMEKVNALFDVIVNATGTEINVRNEAFTTQRLTGYVFMMVDSMEARKSIYESSIKGKSAIKLLVEPRMGLDMSRMYNVEPTNLTHQQKYEDTFYTDEEAEVSACGTSMTVITTAMSVASQCTRQLINHHAGEELDNEILVDYKYNNMITERW